MSFLASTRTKPYNAASVGRPGGCTCFVIYTVEVTRTLEMTGQESFGCRCAIRDLLRLVIGALSHRLTIRCSELALSESPRAQP